MEALNKLRNKFRYGTVLYFCSSNLARLGLAIEPYYLEQEMLYDEKAFRVGVLLGRIIPTGIMFDMD